jgi:hypothetical protein
MRLDGTLMRLSVLAWRDEMKIILAAIVLATMLPGASALAQNHLAVACGPAGTNFEANTADTPHAATPEAGKALVYFILDDGPYGDHQHFTLRAGMDGAWVGAFKRNSYFAVPVMPGEHHICMNVQSIASSGKLQELAHFTAEAGKTYYFRVRFMGGITTLYPIAPQLDIDQPDTDEAKHLIATYPMGEWTEKK